MTSTPAAPRATRRARVAIAGNPNTGKTTVFNRLTGAHQKVGNYAGVTVEIHEGRLALQKSGTVDLLDVPGAYSLSARSREEELAIQAIAGLEPFASPDLVVVVADATQLSRNLYFVLQVLELGLPCVIALNMTDMLAERGLVVDVRALEQELGVPVVETTGTSGKGLAELRERIDDALVNNARHVPRNLTSSLGPQLAEDLALVSEAIPLYWSRGSQERKRALALWALISIDDNDELADVPAALRASVLERRALAAAEGRSIDTEIVQTRYSWIDSRMPSFLKEAGTRPRSRTERIDAVLLNPVAGFLIFLLLMGIVFQSLFTWASPLMGVIEGIFDSFAGWLRDVLPAGVGREFVTEGLIAGVGSVLVFLPQILMLFLFIGLMEDTGYMARAAFLMDRVMRSIGLSGRAFVPMISGYACAVPAILATRTMERQRDRTLTMLVIPLMTCSARLPVYALIIGALFPVSHVFGFVPVQGLLMVGMYLFSTVTALVAAAVLSRTLFKAKTPPLILELPPYRVPHLPSVLRMMWQRSRAFLQQAGGVILVCTVVLWAMLHFPRDPLRTSSYEAQRQALVEKGQSHAELDAREAAENMRRSLGGRLGHAIEPVISPLGFDWKIGIGLVGAFAAREVFVTTMGVVYGAGNDADEASTTLRDKIKAESRADGKPVYTPLVGLSLMIFFALACQCMSTLAAVKRETQGWKWPIFLFAYMSVLAWIASFAVYQGGRALGFD
ncbi:MAG: ferrous iron transport protein B [Planctomycetes bacterium]|nr:ferrous iron transport protein B [Planctomycetota bacterium]